MPHLDCHSRGVGAARDAKTWLPFPEPTEFRFSAEAFAAHRHRFWRLPERLVTSTLWPALWKAHPALTAILPAFALHAYPREDAPFAPWVSVPERHVATLCGLDRKTVSRALASGVRVGVMEREVIQHPSRPAVRMHRYRLAGELFARRGEPFVKIPAALLFGGAWALVPSLGARHLYLTLAALDPVRDVAAFEDAVVARLVLEHTEARADATDDKEEAADYWHMWAVGEVEAALNDARASRLYTVSDLAALSGLARASVRDSVAQTLVWGVKLLRAGRVGEAWWYGHTLPRVETYAPDTLNDPDAFAALRRAIYAGPTWIAGDPGGRRALPGGKGASPGGKGAVIRGTTENNRENTLGAPHTPDGSSVWRSSAA